MYKKDLVEIHLLPSLRGSGFGATFSGRSCLGIDVGRGEAYFSAIYVDEDKSRPPILQKGVSVETLLSLLMLL